MIVIGVIGALWLLVSLVAWALCRVAGTSDEAIEAMHPVDWQFPS
jgi:hypothetical protein